MKISDFINGHNVSYDTVQKYIKRHSEQFIGHLGSGDEIDLDDTAVSILEKKYPLPQPVMIVEDELTKQKLQETMEKLEMAHCKIEELQDKLLAVVPQLADAEKNKLYLEAATNENEILKKEALDKEKKLGALESEIKAYGNLVEELKERLQTEKDKTWWQKLRGK